MPIKVWRKVAGYRIFRDRSCPNHAEGSYVFTLECGHVTHEKVSQGRPRKKRCRDCEYLLQHSAIDYGREPCQ